MKQTAVEYLHENYLDNPLSIEDVLYNETVLKNAKEMEKEQLIDCGNACALLQYIHIDKINKMTESEIRQFAEEEHLTFGEQYYNETFKKQLT